MRISVSMESIGGGLSSYLQWEYQRRVRKMKQMRHSERGLPCGVQLRCALSQAMPCCGRVGTPV